MYWRMFDAAWFARHQRTLLALLNAPVLGRWLRWVLCITQHDVGHRRRITRLLPHAYEVTNDDGSRTLDVRTHPKYAKRLYYGFAWLWWTLHAWDQVIANPLVPALNVGFDTLTVYPDPDPEVTTVDGVVARNDVDETWSTIRAGAGTAKDDITANFYAFLIGSSATSNRWRFLRRCIFLFDTSSIADSAVVTDGTFSLYGINKADNLSVSPDVNVYSTAPASNTALANADYGTFGTTAFATAITYAGVSTSGYNDFALNASGIAAIAKAGITKFGTRNANYDAANVAPTWGNTLESWVDAYHADQTGTANDPKLVVTYTPQGRNRVTLDQNKISAVANFTNAASTSLAFSSAVSAGQLLTLCFTSGSSNGSSGV